MCYLALFAVAGAGLLRFVRQSQDRADRQVGIAALTLGTAYFVQNLFLFDTPTSTLLFFFTLGFASFLVDPAPAPRDASASWRPRSGIVLAGAGALVLALAVFGNWKPYKAAWQGRQAAEAQTPKAVLDRYEHAMAGGGFARVEVTRAVMDALIDRGHARSKEWTDVFEKLRGEAESLLAREPTHTTLFMRLGNLYNERTEIEPRFSADAERVLTAAIALSPSRPDAYYELAVTYLKRKDYVRLGTSFAASSR